MTTTDQTTTTRPNLGAIEKRASEATEGNWSTLDGLDEFGDEGLPLVVVNGGGLVDTPIPHCDEDSRFIANTRADVPALTAALRAVLALHQPHPDPQHMVFGMITACSECGDIDDNPEEYPCPTVRAITAHVDIEGAS